MATMLARQLERGDPEGHLRRALDAFPLPKVAEGILAREIGRKLPKDFVPTYFTFEDVTPGIFENIDTAIKSGKPSLLHRETSRSAIRRNRREAIGAFSGTGSPDEFPFASSKEGGKGAQVRGVQIGEQLRQGAALGLFYRVFKIGNNDAFFNATVSSSGERSDFSGPKESDGS